MRHTDFATYDHVTRTLSGADYMIEFTKYEGVIFGLLWKRHLVTREHIGDALYGHDPNGGPNTERKVIDVLLHNIRRKLREGGANFAIIMRREVGWTLRFIPKGEPPVSAILPRAPAPLAPAVMEAA